MGSPAPLPPGGTGGRGRTFLATGGCRSGKSGMALSWALAWPGPRAFIATADPSGDPEMEARVARHQAERGPRWMTLVALTDPLSALEKAAAAGCGVAVFDSVTTWVAHLVARGDEDGAVLSAVRALAEALEASPALPVALVTDEVGWGIVPETPLGRRFRDLLGEANRMLAAACAGVAISVCGLPLVLKGDPFSAV